MLYTRKGDDGTTKTFGCDQRFSKSSIIAETLGTLDEINSFLGLVKIEAEDTGHKYADTNFSEIVNMLQKDLFIVQAEIAGADKHITNEKVLWLEKVVDGIEKELPPIKTFFISGGSKLGALCDFARTLARRAERRVIAVDEEGVVKVGKDTFAYLNRLSSMLYALARYANFKSNVTEKAPDYK